MSRITRSPGSIQPSEPLRPNEIVTDNKDPDKLNNSAQGQANQPSLAGEAKGMLDLGGSITKKSLQEALESGPQQTAGAALGYGGKLGIVNETEQSAAGAALGYGGKLGIAPEAEQTAASTALGYGGKLGIVPDGE